MEEEKRREFKDEAEQQKLELEVRSKRLEQQRASARRNMNGRALPDHITARNVLQLCAHTKQVRRQQSSARIFGL